MAALDVALTELEEIFAGIERSRNFEIPGERVRAVIENRSKVVKKIAEITRLASVDARIQSNPSHVKQFDVWLQSLRHGLAPLQVKWRVADLEQDFDAYVQDARVSIQTTADFIRWAVRRVRPF